MAEQLLKICKAADNKWAGPAITLSAASGLLKQPFHHRPLPCVSSHLQTERGSSWHAGRGWGEKGALGGQDVRCRRPGVKVKGMKWEEKSFLKQTLPCRHGQGVQASYGSRERLSHAHRSSVPSYIGILLVLVAFLYLASQYCLLKPLAFPTRS